MRQPRRVSLWEELAQLGFTTGSPAQIPRVVNNLLAVCNTLESSTAEVNRPKDAQRLCAWRSSNSNTSSLMRWVPCARRAALTMGTMRPSTRHRRVLAAVDVPQPTTVAADARRRPQESPTLNAVAAAAAVVRCSGGGGGGAVARLLFEEDDGT